MKFFDWLFYFYFAVFSSGCIFGVEPQSAKDVEETKNFKITARAQIKGKYLEIGVFPEGKGSPYKGVHFSPDKSSVVDSLLMSVPKSWYQFRPVEASEYIGWGGVEGFVANSEKDTIRFRVPLTTGVSRDYSNLLDVIFGESVSDNYREL